MIERTDSFGWRTMANWLMILPLVVLASLGVVVLAVFLVFRIGYYDELDYVKAELEKLPNVEVLEISGNEDLTLENIYVTIQIEPGAKLAFDTLTYESFGEGGPLYVMDAEGWEPRITSYRLSASSKDEYGNNVSRWSRRGSIDVSVRGRFASRLSGGMQDVYQAIERNEEIANLVTSFPICPDSAQFLDEEKGWLALYSIARPNSVCFPVSLKYEPEVQSGAGDDDGCIRSDQP